MKKNVISKFTAVLFIILILFAFAPFKKARTFVYAAEDAGEFLRVITTDTPFYADKNADSPLFYIPYTYYVRVIENGERFARVEYGAEGCVLDGYVPTEKLFYDGLSVINPFPQTEIFTANNAVLYKDASLSASVQLLFEARKLYLYGSFISPQNERIYYVFYNNKLGYVKEEDVAPFTVPDHPNELTFLKTEQNDGTEREETEKPSDQSVSTLRVAVIAVLALAGAFALFATLGKKSKTSAAASYYDENDYE